MIKCVTYVGRFTVPRREHERNTLSEICVTDVGSTTLLKFVLVPKACCIDGQLVSISQRTILITDLVYESDARGQDQAGQPTLKKGTPSNTHHRSRNIYIRESKAFYDEKFERKKSL